MDATVIYHPGKVGNIERFTSLIRRVARSHGYDVEFIATHSDMDMAQLVSTRQASLFIAAGGDGTVRAVAQACPEGIAMGIIPMGTGNIIARNLGIPLDFAQSIQVAFSSRQRLCDKVKVEVDGHFSTVYLGIAGIGFDAAVMEATCENLKGVIGPAAYIAGFYDARQKFRPIKISIAIDDGTWETIRAVVMMVGNMPKLMGVPLFPRAKMDDGLLDVAFALPQSPSGWMRLCAAIISRIRRPHVIDYRQGRKITLKIDEPVPWEADGDLMGKGSEFSFEVIGTIPIHVME